MKSSFLSKYEQKCQDFSPHYTGQKSWQFFVCILGEKTTSLIHSEINWPLDIFFFIYDSASRKSYKEVCEITWLLDLCQLNFFLFSAKYSRTSVLLHVVPVLVIRTMTYVYLIFSYIFVSLLLVHYSDWHESQT